MKAYYYVWLASDKIDRNNKLIDPVAFADATDAHRGYLYPQVHVMLLDTDTDLLGKKFHFKCDYIPPEKDPNYPEPFFGVLFWIACVPNIFILLLMLLSNWKLF
jgi:hypothetical protein